MWAPSSPAQLCHRADLPTRPCPTPPRPASQFGQDPTTGDYTVTDATGAIANVVGEPVTACGSTVFVIDQVCAGWLCSVLVGLLCVVQMMAG